MAFPPWWANRDEVEISFLFFFFAASRPEMGAARRCGDFVATIRSELPAPVEKSGRSGP
jgi:hypothetical protein